MYRYKQKNTEKNLLQFFSVFIFGFFPFATPISWYFEITALCGVCIGIFFFFTENLLIRKGEIENAPQETPPVCRAGSQREFSYCADGALLCGGDAQQNYITPLLLPVYSR